MNVRKFLLFLTIIGCIGISGLLADVPHLINFTGTLTDTTGCPITDTRNIQFALYADSIGGTPLWNEAHSSVDVIDGLFHVMLGSATSFPPNLFDGSKPWLGITVSPDVTELTPRQPFVTTPYAYMTEESDHATNADTAAFALSGSPDDDWTISGSNIYRNTGKVGIGIASPSNKLHIIGSENIPLLNVEQNGWGRALRVYNHNVCGIWVEHAGNHGMRITDAVGDGIHVEYSHHNGVHVDSANGWAGYFGGDGYFNGDVGLGTTTPSEKLDIEGDIECTTLHETSDDLLKNNIQTLDKALDNITKLRGVSFEWNEEAESVGATSGEKQIGVLASEVEQVFPELVSSPENGYKSVDYTKLTAVLIEAVKELKSENKELRNNVDTLRGEIAELRQR